MRLEGAGAGAGAGLLRVRSGAPDAFCCAHRRAARDAAREEDMRGLRAGWLWLHCAAISSIAGRSA